jgi:hypothetical protein
VTNLIILKKGLNDSKLPYSAVPPNTAPAFVPGLPALAPSLFGPGFTSNQVPGTLLNDIGISTNPITSGFYAPGFNNQLPGFVK